MTQTEPKTLPDRKRVNFEFPLATYQRLEQMKTRTAAASLAEVVRNALRLYEWFLTKRDEGYELALVKDQEVQRVEVLF